MNDSQATATATDNSLEILELKAEIYDLIGEVQRYQEMAKERVATIQQKEQQLAELMAGYGRS